MMADGTDWDSVAKLVKRGKLEAVRRKIHDMVEILSNKNAIDSLKGVYSKKGDVSSMIAVTVKHLKSLVDKI
jgi:hypothetical protein